jgi:hypothetical protein
MLVVLLPCSAVSRDELQKALKCNRSLTDFIKRSRSVRDSSLSVFDAIEGDDNDTLSWDEFRSYFVSSGALFDDRSKSGRAASATSVTYSLMKCVKNDTKAEQYEVRADACACASSPGAGAPTPGRPPPPPPPAARPGAPHPWSPA